MHHGREGQHGNRAQERRAVSEGKRRMESAASPAGRRRAPNIPFPPRDYPSRAGRAFLPPRPPPPRRTCSPLASRAATGGAIPPHGPRAAATA